MKTAYNMETERSRLLGLIIWKLRYAKTAENSATTPPKRTGILTPTKFKLQTKHPAWRIILNQYFSARWGQRARISLLKPKLNEQKSRFKFRYWRNSSNIEETILRAFRIKTASSFYAFTGWDISAGWLTQNHSFAGLLFYWVSQVKSLHDHQKTARAHGRNYTEKQHHSF